MDRNGKPPQNSQKGVGSSEGHEQQGMSNGNGHSDGYSSSAATNESRPESFGTRSDAKSNISNQEMSEEARLEAKIAEEEDANTLIRAFITDVAPPKSETNMAGGYSVDTLVDLFILLGMPTAIEDIKAALPQTETPLLTIDEVVMTVETIRTSQHVELPRVVASIEACIAKLNPLQYALYKIGCLDHATAELVDKAALVKLDWNIQPKHRLFLSIAAVLVVVGTLIVVVIALLWVNSTYSHVTSQLKDIQRITQLSAVHLQRSDFNALGAHLQWQTETIAAILKVRDNETEAIVSSRASDDVLLLANTINKSDVLHLFTPMAAALHGLKAVVGRPGDDGTAISSAYTATSAEFLVTNGNISDILTAWSDVPPLAPFRKFIFHVPTPAGLMTTPTVGSTSTLSTSSFNTAASSPLVNITLLYDSETNAVLRCMTTNHTAGNLCDGGPLFFKNRYVGLADPSTPSGAAASAAFGQSLPTNATVFNASSPAGFQRDNWPADEFSFYDAVMNVSHYFTTGGETVVRVSRSLDSAFLSSSSAGIGGNGIVGFDIKADGTSPLVGDSHSLDGSFIEEATAMYMSVYIPLRGIAIVVQIPKAAMIEMRKPEVIAMSHQLNGYETGTSMTTRRGSLVAAIDPSLPNNHPNKLTWITPLTRLSSSCYTSTPRTCTAQDDLVIRAWAERRPLIDTVISYTGSKMVVAVAPAAFNLVAVINIPVAVVLSEGRASLSNIIARFKTLMPNAKSGLMLVTRDTKTGVIQPHVPQLYRFPAECLGNLYNFNPNTGATVASADLNANCKRGPTSSLAAELVMTQKTSGWILQQDYRFDPVLAGYAYLSHLDIGLVVEQSAVVIQEKSLQVIINILNTQNAASADNKEETAIVHYAGTPTCETFDRFSSCDSAEYCYKHPIEPDRLGVIYRSDCKSCRPLPIPRPSVVKYITATNCILESRPSCSMANDRVAHLPLVEQNIEPRDIKAKDYRDRTMIAVYSYVPSFSIGIILKVDSKEVQAPIINNVIIAVVIAALIIIIGLIALIVFSRTVLNRIEQEWLRYKVLIDSEKDKYNNLIKTIVPPRIKRDLEILGRSSLTIPSVALSFVDVINFTESVRDWHVDQIAKFVTYYQFTIGAILAQYRIDRVRFIGDAVFSAAGLSAVETNRGRRHRRGGAGTSGKHTHSTGLSGVGGGGKSGSVPKDGNQQQINDNHHSDSSGNNSLTHQHTPHQQDGTPQQQQGVASGGGGGGSKHNSQSNNSNRVNSLQNQNRSNSVQSTDSEGGLSGVGGVVTLDENGQPIIRELTAEQRKMGRKPPIYRQACYAAAVIELFSARFAHFPEDVPEVEEMFSSVTEEHGAVFPNVYTTKAGNPEDVGTVIMPPMRIGIHCGPATFSMLEIGNTPSFDLFGPSVALAKRMEATCTANRVHLTEQAKELLEMADTEMSFTFDAARKTAVKGIGTINSYFLATADLAIPDELVKTIHVQHAVRRVYHEEFANNNDNGGGGGGAPKGSGGVVSPPPPAMGGGHLMGVTNQPSGGQRYDAFNEHDGDIDD